MQRITESVTASTVLSAMKCILEAHHYASEAYTDLLVGGSWLHTQPSDSRDKASEIYSSTPYLMQITTIDEEAEIIPLIYTLGWDCVAKIEKA